MSALEEVDKLKCKLLETEIELMRALHYIILLQFENGFEIQINSSEAARNFRALTFHIVDEANFCLNNKRDTLGRVLEGVRVQVIDKTDLKSIHWMMDDELLAIKEYLKTKKITLLIYHENDIKSYIDPFDSLERDIIMIHCYRNLHFSGVKPLKNKTDIYNACVQLQKNYNIIEMDFASFFNDLFEIIDTVRDGNCGYHAILNSAISTISDDSQDEKNSSICEFLEDIKYISL